MADESLIEEMRVAIRGDRERAEQRRREAPAPAPAVVAESPPGEAQFREDECRPELEDAPHSVGWWGRLRRRRDH
jgi:hypothetical protein